LIGFKRIRLIFLIVVLLGPCSAAEASPGGKVVAYYFRGTFRSPACRHLEKNCREAIEANFKDALASGKLEFQVVTLGDKGEGYYANYYKIYARTLILSLVKDGKELKWKNLDKAGAYMNNQEGFLDYINKEVSAFLGEI